MSVGISEMEIIVITITSCEHQWRHGWVWKYGRESNREYFCRFGGGINGTIDESPQFASKPEDAAGCSDAGPPERPARQELLRVHGAQPAGAYWLLYRLAQTDSACRSDAGDAQCAGGLSTASVPVP